MAEVLIDIESTGRTHKSVFAVAICAQFQDGTRTSKVFYMPEVSEEFRSPNTIKWWTSDEHRKEFLEKTLEKCKQFDRTEVINDIRKFIDELYLKEADDKELVFYSDFTVFDIGLVNAMLAEQNHLPIYMKNDEGWPREVVDSSTYIKGLANVRPEIYSSKAYEILNIKREDTSTNHDPLVDVDLMMNDVQNILKQLFKLDLI